MTLTMSSKRSCLASMAAVFQFLVDEKVILVLFKVIFYFGPY